jgi:hypothetical protein
MSLTEEERQSEEARRKGFEDVTFIVTCTMKRRWAAQFIGMLQYMQKLGSWGSSRDVSFHADGDGDYRPRFQFVGDLPEANEGREIGVRDSGKRHWDAG